MGAREIRDRAEIDRVIFGSQVCRLAVTAAGEPYIVPVSFGYDGKNLYLHTGPGGRKIDAFESSSRVCFEFEQGVKLRGSEDNPCGWSFSYRSVIGYGSIAELQGEDKIAGLNRIMIQYSGREWEFGDKILAKTRVWKIEISEISGRINGE